MKIAAGLLKRLRLGSCAAVAVTIALLGGPAGSTAVMVPAAPLAGSHVIPAAQARAQRSLNTDAQIYLLRGLANVFSRGMDEMGATLQARGFSAEDFARSHPAGR